MSSFLLQEILPAPYFVNTTAREQATHRALLARFEGEAIIEFSHRPHSRLTELTLCAFDDREPGLLAKVCSALYALNIEVRTAYIYTFDAERLPQNKLPQEPLSTQPSFSQHSLSSQQVAFDVLFLCRRWRHLERPLSKEGMKETREALSRILVGRPTWREQLMGSWKRSQSALQIEDIAIEPRPASDGLTRIELRARDSAALLLRATAAMAALNLDIRIAQINSSDGDADDIFYVRGRDGQPLSPAAIAALPEKLRAQLT